MDHRLVFVVTKEIVNGYKRQDGYGDIKQYVMIHSALHEKGTPMKVDDA